MAATKTKTNRKAKATVDRTYRGLMRKIAENVRIEAFRLGVVQGDVLNRRLAESFERTPVASHVA